MLYLTLLTMTLVTSQSLEMEVSHIVEEYLSQVDLAPTQYEIVISDQVPEGAALVRWVEASGKDTAVFLFERELMFQGLTKEAFSGSTIRAVDAASPGEVKKCHLF